MSLVLNVEILGEFKNLTKATQGSQSELQNLNKKIGSFSKFAAKAFASIGVGLSFAFITRELTDATKAAVEDNKAQQLLAKQLENTTGANQAQIKSVETSIAKWQVQSGVLDDNIRPAYATLIRSTGDITKANGLMSLALDVSAGTGKSLEAVALALGKAVNGSETALVKLVPSIKGSKDGMGDLQKQFEGAAATAANNDPYMRFGVIMADLQEKIGGALLPVLEDFSRWLASPGGTQALKLVSDAIVDILNDMKATVKWVVANKDWVLPLAAGIGAITTAWKVATTAAEAYAAIAGIASAAGAAGKGIPTGVGVGLGVLGTVAGVLSLSGDTAQPGKVPSTTKAPAVKGKAPAVGTNLLSTKSTSSGITVNVTQAVTAKTIIDTVAKYEKATGTTLAQALR